MSRRHQRPRLAAHAAIAAAACLIAAPARATTDPSSDPHAGHGEHAGMGHGAQDPHAQHAGHDPDTHAGHDPAEHAGHDPAEHEGHMHGGEAAPAPTLFDIETARNASGTAWQPELTPHAGFHHTAGGWQLMLHALLFAGYDYQAGDRGDRAPVGIGWLMGMATRRIGSGGLTGRVMLSPDPFTAAAGGGYPLLLQTGETYQGLPLHDRQHPHDLFMEVAALYTQALGDTVAVQVYAAPAGEPALGPVAFPHRYSSSSDPLAAIVHHWQDSSHISYGVLTAGVLTRWGKLEGSWFNGREPDENRLDFDLARLDAYAVRASLAPAPRWSGQLSYGYLPDHDVLHPGVSLHRATASVMYHRPLAAGSWASTAVFGFNKHGGSGDQHGPAGPSNAYLLESNLDLDGANVLFARAEVVDKTGEDLVLPAPLAHDSFTLASLAAGYLRNLPPFAGLLAGLGLRAAVALVPAPLRPTYGSRTLLGGILYLRLAAAPTAGGHHH